MICLFIITFRSPKKEIIHSAKRFSCVPSMFDSLEVEVLYPT